MCLCCGRMDTQEQYLSWMALYPETQGPITPTHYKNSISFLPDNYLFKANNHFLLIINRMENPNALRCTPFIASSPLWSRVPARDEDGKPYSDFMMLIPGLKKANEATVEGYLLKIRDSLLTFESVVVYVDLNIRLNLLWISIKPVPGITRHMVEAIQRNIPHARVVAGDFNPDILKDRPLFSGWLTGFRQRMKKNLLLISAKVKRNVDE